MEEAPPPPQPTAPTTEPPPAEAAASNPTEPPSEPPPPSSSTSTSAAAVASSPSPIPSQNPPTQTQTPSQVLQSQQRPSIAGNRPPQSSSLSSPSPFSSFGPSRSSAQPFSPLSANQVRQSIQGLSKIGTSSLIGGSQMRPSGVFGHQTLGQSSLRSITPSTSQSLSSQKFHGHILSRPPSMASSSSPSTFPPSRPQSLQQPLGSTQGKQVASSLPSPSYRPQVRPPAMQQRPHIQQHQHSLPTSSHQQQISSSQQQKHQQLQMHQRLQQQQQASPSQQSQESRQQYLPLKNQQSIPQQQGGRGQVSASQNTTIPAITQSGVVRSGVIASNAYAAAESGNHIINKRSIRELVNQIDPSEKLDPEVEDVLVEIGDDFIESITMFACSLAKHRKSTMLEAKDILQHVERNWNLTLPGFGGDEIKSYKKQLTNDIHKERLAVIKKSMVGTNETVNMKNGPAAQAASNLKAHVAKAPAPGSPK